MDIELLMQVKIRLSFRFSHNIVLEIVSEVKVETISEKGKNPIVKLTSFDKQLLGQVAAKKSDLSVNQNLTKVKELSLLVKN